MASNRGRPRLHLNNVGHRYADEFFHLLRMIHTVNVQKLNKNPIELARKQLMSDHAGYIRLLRKLNHLLELGAIRFEIKNKVIETQAGEFYKAWNGFLFTSEDGLLKLYLKERRGVEFVHAETPESLYRELTMQLIKALKDKPDTQVLVSHGRTIAGFARMFENEIEQMKRSDPKEMVKSRRLFAPGGEPMFLPACGNFASSDLLTPEAYEYFYDLSSNENAKSLNAVLGRRSLRLAIPAIMPIESVTEALSSAEVARIKERKRDHKKNSGYTQIYDEQGWLNPRVATLLYTFGTPLDTEKGQLTYTKFLQEFDPEMKKFRSRLGKMTEILFRFFEDGALIGEGKAERLVLSSPGTLESRLNILYYAYLGLKESSCMEVARAFRKAKSTGKPTGGLGSVVIATGPEKMESLLLAMLKAPTSKRPEEALFSPPGRPPAEDTLSFINTVYMPSSCMQELVRAMKKMPKAYQEQYEAWVKYNAK